MSGRSYGTIVTGVAVLVASAVLISFMNSTDHSLQAVRQHVEPPEPDAPTIHAQLRSIAKSSQQAQASIDRLLVAVSTQQQQPPQSSPPTQGGQCEPQRSCPAAPVCPPCAKEGEHVCGADHSYLFSEFAAEYDRVVAAMRNGRNPSDGSIHATNRAEMSFLVSRSPEIHTVCETGFNVGTSAFIWLSNPAVKKLYTFDVDVSTTPEKKSSLEYLQKRFPGRIEYIEGNSEESITRFYNANPTVECDLVLVDGGHGGSVPASDMRNFAKLASRKGAIVLADDYGDCGYCHDVKAAWDGQVAAKNIIHIGCMNTCFGSFSDGYNARCEPGHYYCYGRYPPRSRPEIRN
jgi:hypothetical protein